MPSAVSKIWVFRNGVKLTPAVDYTTGTGQINLTSSISAMVVGGDLIEVQWVK